MSTPAWEVVHGDCLDVMGRMREACVDAIVTDPPYGLVQNKKGGSGVASINLGSPYGRARIGTGNGPGGFMGMKWDGAVPGADFWREALRVAKPGAHLLAFGGTRTFHRLVVAIEGAGWEVRDQIAWIYSTGFPKSHNLDGDREGWGTALKPAMEPICVARKPLVGTVARNVETFGTGALNIDGCRVGTGEVLVRPAIVRDDNEVLGKGLGAGTQVEPSGRWPANVVHDGSDEVLAGFPESKGQLARSSSTDSRKTQAIYGAMERGGGSDGVDPRGDSGSAARFFYCAKASRSERNDGLDGFPEALPLAANGSPNAVGTTRGSLSKPTARANTHPTVKPVALMRWLCRLVTPPGGIVLDPFTGSGTTGVAAIREGFRFIGIEREAQYVEIARARIANAVRP